MGRRKQALTHLRPLSPEAIQWTPGDDPPSEEAIERMAHGLERTGLRHPLLVLELPPRGKGPAGVRLVVGRKRLLAARRLAWSTVDCIVLPPESAPEGDMVERLRTESIDPWILGDTLQALKTRYGWTQDQLGHAIGKTRDFAANYLPIARIQPEVRDYLVSLENGPPMSARHLRYIGRTPPARQLRIAKKIVEQGMTTKSLEEENKGRASTRRYFKVRPLPKGVTRKAPATLQVWRKAYRQIQTDLRRLERKETQEIERAQKTIAQTRERLRDLRRAATNQRRTLERELRRVVQRLAKH